MVFLFASCGLVSFLLFFLKFCLFCFHSYQNKKAKNGHGKNLPNQKYRKTPQNVFSVSAVVFTNSVPISWLVGLRNAIIAENAIKVVAQHILLQPNGRTLSKCKLQNLGSKHTSKLVQVCCATYLDQFLTFKTVKFDLLCFLYLILLAERRIYKRTRKEN